MPAGSPAAPARTAESPSLPHLSGLDGLRALAVIAVLGYHLNPDLLPGGFLGVDLFFVISGYLITGLLLGEHARTGRLDVREFWRRRARRLLPAVGALIVATVAFAVVVLPDDVSRLRADALAAAAYVTNWFLIVGQHSYFEDPARPSLLQHLWSLAVEEQFYILWPLFLIVGLAVLGRRRSLAVTVGLAVGSALWMALLYSPDVDPSRLYYGTDTRAAGLLIGAALAFVWLPSPGTDGRTFTWPSWSLRLPGRAADGLALAALAALGWFMLESDPYGPFLFQGGFFAVAIVAAVLIAAVVHPLGHLGPGLLDRQPLRYLGVRSYSIYLWHWPIFLVTRPGVDVALGGFALVGLRIGLTLALAELSFRAIERPIRGGVLGRTWARWSSSNPAGAGPGARVIDRPLIVASCLAVVTVMIAAVNVVVAQPPDPASSQVGLADSSPAVVVALGPGASVAAGEEPSADPAAADSGTTDPAATDPATDPSATGAAGPSVSGPGDTSASSTGSGGPDASADPGTASSSAGTPGSSAAATPATSSKPPSSPSRTPAPKPVTGTQGSGPARTPTPTAAPATGPPAAVLAVGDSVMLGAVSALRHQFGSIDVDAVQSRQFTAGLRLLSDRAAAGRLPNTVIVHLGTNGPFTPHQLDQLMTVLHGVNHVVLVNLKVPDAWEGYVNRVLAGNVGKYPNAVLVDWHAASVNRPELFWNDGTHLRPLGAQVYASLLAAAAP